MRPIKKRKEINIRADLGKSLNGLVTDINSWNLFFQDNNYKFELLGIGTYGAVFTNGDYVIKFYTSESQPSLEDVVGQYLYTGDKMKMSGFKYTGPPIPKYRGNYIKTIEDDKLLNIMDTYTTFDFTTVPGLYLEILLTIYNNINLDINMDARFTDFISNISNNTNTTFKNHIKNILQQYNTKNKSNVALFPRSDIFHRQITEMLGTLTMEDLDVELDPLFITILEYTPINIVSTINNNIHTINELNDMLLNILIQVCGTLHGLQSTIKFVHGDLSPNNITATKMKQKETFTYELSSTTTISTTTETLYTMIDFGFSDFDNIQNKGKKDLDGKFRDLSYRTDLHHFGITLLYYINEFLQTTRIIYSTAKFPIVTFIHKYLLIKPDELNPMEPNYTSVYNKMPKVLNMPDLIKFRFVTLADSTLKPASYWNDPIFNIKSINPPLTLIPF